MDLFYNLDNNSISTDKAIEYLYNDGVNMLYVVEAKQRNGLSNGMALVMVIKNHERTIVPDGELNRKVSLEHMYQYSK